MSKIEYSISILIPVWNAEQYIEKGVNFILANNYENYKIILIAGGHDKTLEIAINLQNMYPDKIIVLEQKIPHKNKALNIGLKAVNGEIIVLTDIDCIHQQNWLTRINEIFQDNKYNVITSYFLPYQEQKNSLAEYFNILNGDFIINHNLPEVIKGGKLWGGNSAFRSEVFFKKIKKFNENIKTGTDKNIGIEFNKKNELIYFFKDIYSYTEIYSNNLKKFIRQRIRWTRNLVDSAKVEKKYYFVILLLTGFGLFKLVYPIIALLISFLIFDVSFIWLFLLPWFSIFILYIIKDFFRLKKFTKRINKQLQKNFNYKKAFKIVPILYFIFGIIHIISYLFPKKRKWLTLE